MTLTEIIQEQIKLSQSRAKTYRENCIGNPYVGILEYNADPSSVAYVASKCMAFTEYGIKYDILEDYYPETADAFEDFTHIIPQLPFNNTDIKLQDVLKLLRQDQDVDRLKKDWLFEPEEDSLPVTAVGLKRILDSLIAREGKQLKILFIGNGLTTNRNLYLQMFHSGYRVKQANSKTSKHGNDLNDMIEWADVIVEASGCPEILCCKGKIVISPTLAKMSDGTWVSGLDRLCRASNETHPVLRHLGKLTVALLIERIWKETFEKI